MFPGWGYPVACCGVVHFRPEDGKTMDLHKEAARIFDDLFLVTVKELGLMGIQVEPGDVIKKVISLVKDVYLKGLVELLALMSGQKSGETPKAEALEEAKRP
jgi:hypothetical protein